MDKDDKKKLDIFVKKVVGFKVDPKKPIENTSLKKKNK